MNTHQTAKNFVCLMSKKIHFNMNLMSGNFIKRGKRRQVEKRRENVSSHKRKVGMHSGSIPDNLLDSIAVML